MSMFLPSLVVLLCAVGVAAIIAFSRVLRDRGLRAGRGPCQLVSRVELSPQHVLYVVETAERRLLLGGAPGGLSLLTELPRPTENRAEASHEAPRKELAA